jgi:glycosyltransferase involved in cell wall biosynthesis
MTRAEVLFIYRRNRARKRDAKQLGDGPDEMLYGLDHLPADRFTTGFIEDDESRRSLPRLLWRPVEKAITRSIEMGFALPMIRENLDALARADILISTVDTCGLPLCMRRYRGSLDTPLIYISQGLTDRLARLRPGGIRHRFFTRLYGRYLRQADRIVVLGEGAVEPFVDLFGLSLDKVVCLPFGIDADFWHPAPDPNTSTTGEILSVGSDLSRDYSTLLKAAGDEVRLHVITRTKLRPDLLGQRTAVSTHHTDKQLRRLYQESLFVVTPLRDVAQPSGQSATLQAMACGKAVILTKTRGLWEPERLLDDENCLLVEPGDVRGLRAAMDVLLQDPAEADRLGRNARQTVEAHCTSRHFSDRLAEQIKQVLHDSGCHRRSGSH